MHRRDIFLSLCSLPAQQGFTPKNLYMCLSISQISTKNWHVKLQWFVMQEYFASLPSCFFYAFPIIFQCFAELRGMNILLLTKYCRPIWMGRGGGGGLVTVYVMNHRIIWVEAEGNQKDRQSRLLLHHLGFDSSIFRIQFTDGTLSSPSKD
jgi:hypothetical protein